jgi:hypothetical protein
VQGLKRNLPEAAPEYWARRNQMEDTLMALVAEVYEEVPVAAIVGKRVIKANTGAHQLCTHTRNVLYHVAPTQWCQLAQNDAPQFGPEMAVLPETGRG